MKISGHVDLCGPELIEGWLFSAEGDGEPIKLQVYVEDGLIGECVAYLYRPDLQEAGYGDGRCGFSFEIPDDLKDIDFSTTKLKLVETPVFLLPDEYTNVAVKGQGSANEVSSRSRRDMPLAGPDSSVRLRTRVISR